MKQDFLKGIYAIDATEELGVGTPFRLLYSPFNGKMTLASEKEWMDLSQAIANGRVIDESLQSLVSEKSIEEVHDLKINSVNDVVKLSVLPTNKCNFKCVYCYSKEGRDSTQLSQEALDRTLEFFINPKRIEKRNLTISYLGGGEPMLCWELFKHSLDYSAHLAQKYGFNLMNSVNTNGSILTDEILEYLLKYDVTVCVTFEVFEDIQNAQRGQWERVRDNIKKMLSCGVRVIVSSIITPLNVNRIERLVNILTTEYSGVRTIIIEPVVDMASSSFKDLTETKEFYDEYTLNFFKALPNADKHNVRLLNSVVRKMWRLHTRFCDGEISLTALGTISGCTSVSSPREVRYTNYCYGDANTAKITINADHFKDLLKRDVFSLPRCEGCFLKWHCAGGCAFRNDIYSDEQMDVVCDFNRRFALKYLLDILNHNLTLEGESLSEYLCHEQG